MRDQTLTNRPASDLEKEPAWHDLGSQIPHTCKGRGRSRQSRPKSPGMGRHNVDSIAGWFKHAPDFLVHLDQILNVFKHVRREDNIE